MNNIGALKQQNKKLLVDLFSVCMDIQYGKTGNGVFFDVAGHVDTLRVEVCESRDEYRNKETLAKFYKLASDPEITCMDSLKELNENIKILIIETRDLYDNKKACFSDMEKTVKLDVEVLRKKKNDRLCLLPNGETLWIDDNKSDFKKNNITSTKRFATDNNIPYSE